MLAGEGAGVDTLKEGLGIGDRTWYNGETGAKVDVLNKFDNKRRGSRYWSSGVSECGVLEAMVARAVRGKSNKSCSLSEKGEPNRWTKEWRTGESSRLSLVTAVVDNARDTNM